MEKKPSKTDDLWLQCYKWRNDPERIAAEKKERKRVFRAAFRELVKLTERETK